MPVIRLGSRGPAVRSFQEFLIGGEFLPEGEADSIAGPKTVAAIRRFQAARQLSADGVAGRQTLAAARDGGWDDGGPTKEQLTAAEALDIPVRVVQAIERVESGGNPAALRFEPHLFLRKRPDLDGQVPYTPGPRGFSVTQGETNKAAFEHAFALDPGVATKSTSFGLYQVLGGHLITLYSSPERGVDEFYSEPTRVSYELFVQWFRASPAALGAARRGDWATLSRIYNGPGNVAHYSAALRRAHEALLA